MKKDVNIINKIKICFYKFLKNIIKQNKEKKKLLRQLKIIEKQKKAN